MWRVSVHFAEECFSKAFYIEGCRCRLILGSIPTIWKIEPGKQTTTPQGKPCLILSKLQYCVSREVFSVFRRSILYVKSQTSLRFVNISSSNSSILVLFISSRYCILVFYTFCLFQSCGTLVRFWFTEEPFNGFQNFQFNRNNLLFFSSNTGFYIYFP